MASERYLLVQLADIGDLALTTPAISALREARPSATIDLFAAEQALPLIPDGLVDNHIPFRRAGGSMSRAFLHHANLRRLLALRRRKYSAVVFFHHFTLRAGVAKFWLIAKASGARRVIGLQNGQVGFLTDSIPDSGFGVKHQAQYWLDLVALLGASAKPRPAQARRESMPGHSERRLPGPARPRVVIHPGSGGYSPARRWHIDGFAEVARQLHAERDAEIILVGQAEDGCVQLREKLRFAARDYSGRTTLPQLADVIARADLFIGADSGVMHIAAAVGAPIVSIFGPSNADAWQPWAIDGRAIVLRSGVECSPCSYVGGRVGAREGCAARTCMKLVTAAQVVEAAGALLDGGRDAAGPALSHPKVPARGAFRRMKILGAPVDAATYESWLEQVGLWARERDGARHVCTVNPEYIMIARRDPIFFNVLNRAALCLPDGVGLLWASRYLGAPLPQRVTGSDGVPLLARRAAQCGWRIFFLGAAPGVAERAAAILREEQPGLRVAGAYAGSPDADEEDAIVDMINRSGADILLVAYGAPEQDKWIARNLPRLQVAMAMGVGGSFDFIAGRTPRAPRWMRERGLEWLYRLLRQPWRMRRMTRLPRFVLAVVWRGRG